MPLNKFAAFGVFPPPRPRGPGIGDVLTQGFGTSATALDRIGTEIAKQRGTPTPPVPSLTALRVVWSLNAVRDALCDQNQASAQDTNTQIEHRRDSHAVSDIVAFLGSPSDFADLLEPYKAQFRPLTAGEAAFGRERCERLAELAGVEWQVMARVTDPSPTTGAAPGRPSSKRR